MIENKFIELLNKFYIESLPVQFNKIIEEKLDYIRIKFPELIEDLEVFGFLEWDLETQCVIENLPVLIRNRSKNNYLSLVRLTQLVLEESFVHFLVRTLGDEIFVLKVETILKNDNYKNSEIFSLITFSKNYNPIPTLEIKVAREISSNTVASCDNWEIFELEKSMINKTEENQSDQNISQIFNLLSEFNIESEIQDFFFEVSNKKSYNENDIKKLFKSILLPLVCGFNSYFVILKPIIKNWLNINFFATLEHNLPKYIVKLGTVGLSYNPTLPDDKLKLLIIYHISTTVEDIFYDFQKINKKHALRSAVAAIMARNMSHNIGSHVLNYLSNPEEFDNLWVI